MIIETKRLILRPIYADDAQDIFEYSKQPDVGPNAGWKPHESLEETIGVMNSIFINAEGVFGIVVKKTEKLIGTIGLVEDPKRDNKMAKMLEYALSNEYWGEGIMTEAAKAIVAYGFEKMGLNLISAYCYPHNERSKSVLNKCGLEYEGTLRQSEILFNGEVYDNECYSISRKRFELLRLKKK